jgi:hypothetical protein
MRKIYFSEEEKKEAKRKNAKKYYESPKGKLFRTEYDKEYKLKNRDSIREYQRKRRKSKQGYLDRFTENAKIRTPDTDITREYLETIFNDFCSITKVSFQYEKSYEAYHNALAPSIDQINPGKGYYKGNVQIVLNCINRMKNDMPNEEFLELWGALTNGP